MIIKSMSRKHASFAQLIDYIEKESKLKSRQYSIHHNLYSREREHLKREFADNAKHLRFRKNGVYLYHEVLSITRSQTLTEDEQKTALRAIVEKYLEARGKNHLAYSVLHEDTDNLHFHIVMSANEVGNTNRKRLSKAEFAGIQTSLEKWVLTHYSELEQKAVFHQNQTTAERAERETRQREKTHLSNDGEELKRRGGKTSIRDDIAERLTDIFHTATDPRHFTELLEKAGFTLYTRGKNHGAIDQHGNKYRFERLGLADSWQALDERMRASYKATQQELHRADEKSADTPQATEKKSFKPEPPEQQAKDGENDIEQEAQRRLEQIRAIRSEKAKRAEVKQSTKQTPDKER
jgi:hypothetical protein